MKRNYLVVVGILVLIFGMTAVGCDNGESAPTTTMIYDPNGIWDFNFNGTPATATIIGNSYAWIVPGTAYHDEGTFTLNGNVATLHSDYVSGTPIGTVTLTSSTTITLRFVDTSWTTAGTYYGTKRATP